jgi:CarD family transcriptional regulator
MTKVVNINEVIAKQDIENDLVFNSGDLVVYPAHGVGEIQGKETMNVGREVIEFYNIKFAKDRLVLKLPLNRVGKSGLRNLLTEDQFEEALDVIKQKAKIRRIMWAKRAQEYKAKIESGEQLQVAEVLRDLSRNCSVLETSEDQSYSERKFYKAALYRFASEYSIVKDISYEKGEQEIEKIISGKVKKHNPILDQDVEDAFEEDLEDFEDDFDDEDDEDEEMEI